MNKKFIMVAGVLVMAIIVMVAIAINKNSNNYRESDKVVQQERVKDIVPAEENSVEMNVVLQTDENGNQKLYDENGEEIPYGI